jgi:hypothetical protein
VRAPRIGTDESGISPTAGVGKWVLAGAAVCVLLGGCAAGSNPTTGHAARSTTTVLAPPVATSTPPPAGFTSAKAQWELGATASAAAQGGNWLAAADDLNGAISSAGADTSGYQTAVRELRQLAALPDTSETPPQKAEAQFDTTALNAFFGTSGLYQ